jgi:decaprenylphospho-beta-D-erythro-pentofuranosid-2-ulose 2-reductase
VESVLLLGGDSDIGVAIARRLVRRGAREVLLAGRNHERLASRATALKSAGAERVETAFFDADEVDGHDPFFQELFARFGRFDVVVVAFGVLGDQEAAQSDPAVAVAMVRTNFLGAASALVHAGERLRAQGQGTLVVLSSVAAQRPRRSNFIYGSSKAGLDALAEGMAFVLREAGVQVLTVRPGFVTTKMTGGMRKAPFATTPGEVAKATVAAIESGRELIWVPGVLRYVMWVMRFVPRPVFRRLKF